MISEIYDWESKIIAIFILNQKTAKAIDHFGSDLFTSNLISGIRNSIDAYFHNDQTDITEIRGLLYNMDIKIQNLSKKLTKN